MTPRKSLPVLGAAPDAPGTADPLGAGPLDAGRRAFLRSSETATS